MEGSPRVSEDVNGCLKTTSIKGLPRVFKAKSKYMKGLWLVATFGFLCFALYQTSVLVQSYLKYETVSFTEEFSMQEASAQNLLSSSLAAVTFCNNNPIPSVQHLSSDNLTYSEYRKLVKKMEYPDIFESPSSYYRYVPIHNLTHIGQKQENFLLTCHYTIINGSGVEKLPCHELATIKVFSNVMYFNCFTVELDMSKLPPMAMPIIMSGVIHLDNIEDLISTISFSSLETDLSGSGATVIFHQPGEYPNILQAAALPSGFESIIHTKLLGRKRMPYPYGSCEDNTRKFYNYQGTEFIYSVNACVSKCLQQRIIEECGCTEPNLEVLSSNEDALKYHMCGKLHSGVDSTKELRCVRDTLTSNQNITCIEKCHSLCEQVDTTYTTSYLEWPRPKYQLSIYQSLIQNTSFQSHFSDYQAILDDHTTMHINDSEVIQRLEGLSTLRMQLLKFTINADQVTFTIIKDKEKMSVTELLSQIGGILNLYSGITFLIFVELVELLFNIFKTTITTGGKTQIKPFEGSKDGSI